MAQTIKLKRTSTTGKTPVDAPSFVAGEMMMNTTDHKLWAKGDSYFEILTENSTIDADTLDTLNSTQFLRSDEDDTIVGTLSITDGIRHYTSNGVVFDNIALKNNRNLDDGYIKFVTPFMTSHNQMFSIDIVGYDFSAHKSIDFTIVGYAYRSSDAVINYGFSNRSSFNKEVRIALEDRGGSARQVVIALGHETSAGVSDESWYYQKFSATVRVWAGHSTSYSVSDFSWVNEETTLASGFWETTNINNLWMDAHLGTLTGTASKATKLATARTLTVGSTGKTFDGSSNVSWSLAEIGAQPAGSYDNYGSWSFSATDTQTIQSGETITLNGSGATSVTNSGNTITISSTDTTYTSSDFTHDSLSGVDADEHIDWTVDDAKVIHSANYTNTTYSIQDGELSEKNLTSALKTNYDTAYTHSQSAHAPSNADNTSSNETSHSDVLVDGDFSTAGLMKTDGSGTYSIDTSTYLTSISSESIKSLSDVYTSMSPTDGQVLTYDTTNGWQAEDISEIVATPTKVDFTATSGQTVFTTDYNTESIDIIIGGVKLRSDEYTATNGTSITLDSPCDAGTWVQVLSNDSAPALEGNGIDNITRTSGDGSEGTTDVYTVTYTNTLTDSFDVHQGSDGNSITSVTRTSGDGSEGTTDVYTIAYTKLVDSSFNVYNGSDGIDGLGWTSGAYDSGTGVVTFVSSDGLGFATDDLRGVDGTGTVTNFTATSNQTTFTVSYDIGKLAVFIGGIKLRDTEYVATNGTSVVLNSSVDEDTWVQISTTNFEGNLTNAGTLDYHDTPYFLDWTNFTNTPTTVSGYGITDAYTAKVFSILSNSTVQDFQTAQVVQWDTTPTTTDSTYSYDQSSSNSKVYVNATGLYKISGTIGLTNTGTGRASPIGKILINGTAYSPSTSDGYSRGSAYNANVWVKPQAIISLTSGDYIELQGSISYADQVTAVNKIQADTIIYIEKL